MIKKRLVVSAYLLLGLEFLCLGLLLLLAPGRAGHWLSPLLGQELMPLPLRLWGLVYLAWAPMMLWCAQHVRQRRFQHAAASVYVVGAALVQMMSSPARWSMAAGLWFYLPALFMVIMALPPMPSRLRGPRERGQVKWFNATKGFGFITRSAGDDVFVHYRSIRGEGHRTLREGQQVEFVVVHGEKGLQAEDVHPT